MSHLPDIIRNRLLPWAREGISNRIVIAQTKIKKSCLPYSVKLTHRKIHGKRQIIKGGRIYGNTRLIRAKWPEMGLHETENIRFICVIDGRMNYQVSDYLLTCSTGDFIYIPAGVPHPGNEHIPDIAFSDSSQRSCTLLFMSSYRRAFQCWLSEYTQNSRIDKKQENYLFTGRRVLQLFNLLMNEVSEYRYPPLCNSLTLSFVLSLIQEIEQQHYLHVGLPIINEFNHTMNEFTVDLEDYIKQRLNEQFKLKEVARHFHLSRAQFVRYIKQETGKTFIEFLTDYRINEAKVLLRETEWTVAAISMFLGYNSPHYFQAVFKRNVGKTPTQFRKSELFGK